MVMGLLDSVIGAVAGGMGGKGRGGTQGVLLNAVIAMLANRQGQGGAGGGLGDLIGKFTQGGMGDVIGSWVGPGQNAPISGDQLSSVLGSDSSRKCCRRWWTGSRRRGMRRPVASVAWTTCWRSSRACRKGAERARWPAARQILRAEPATRSKRNSRHSIGPFHIGTRRDSFSRIALGSFMSGLST
jgi:YidB-like protein